MEEITFNEIENCISSLIKVSSRIYLKIWEESTVILLWELCKIAWEKEQISDQRDSSNTWERENTDYEK